MSHLPLHYFVLTLFWYICVCVILVVLHETTRTYIYLSIGVLVVQWSNLYIEDQPFTYLHLHRYRACSVWFCYKSNSEKEPGESTRDINYYM